MDPSETTPVIPAEHLEQVRVRLGGARNVLVVSGPGLSAESGIPAVTAEEVQAFVTAEAFRESPHEVWEFLDQRRQMMARARPNPAHQALAGLEQTGRRVFIITLNVDDLHERAGSHEVVHVFGSIWHLRCERDGSEYENREVPLAELPPLCFCGNILRPDIVWFGDTLPAAALSRIQRYFLAGPINVCFLLDVEASSGYLLEWAMYAQELGALVVDIKPGQDSLSSLAGIHLAGKPSEILPKLFEGLASDV